MWYKIRGQTVELHILAKPNAKKTTLVDISEQGLHIALHAKPHKGEANKALIAYLATLFKVPKSQVMLQKGEGSRYKRVLLPLNASVQQLLDNPANFIA